jgi:hypothetical protein
MTRRVSLAGPAEAYVGSHGIYLHGRYVSWGLPWLTLASVKLEAGDPTVLHFEVKGRQGGVQQIRAMVPKGKEADAKRLLSHFPGGRPSPSRSARDKPTSHREQ